jgi:hypothetical protein
MLSPSLKPQGCIFWGAMAGAWNEIAPSSLLILWLEPDSGGSSPQETPTSAATRMIDSVCLTVYWCVMMTKGMGTTASVGILGIVYLM